MRRWTKSPVAPNKSRGGATGPPNDEESALQAPVSSLRDHASGNRPAPAGVPDSCDPEDFGRHERRG